jgi:transglutaminase-like putative cysteine protease
MARDPLLLCLRGLFRLVLVAIAAWCAGPPSGVTCFLSAALFVVAGGARALLDRGRGGVRTLLPLAWLVGIALAAAGVSTLAAGGTGELAATWLLLAVAPAALGAALREAALVPTSPLAAVFFYATVALGLLGAEPWADLVGRLLLSLLAVAGVVCAALEATTRLQPRRLPPPPRAAWRRTAATVLVLAVLALLSGVGVDLVLAPLDRSWQEPPPPPPPEDRLTQQLAAAGGDPGRSIALVRLAAAGGTHAERPPRLHLRERVLDDCFDGDGLLYLAPRPGSPAFVRDEADGSADGRIAAREPVLPDGAASRASSWQITLLTRDARSLPQLLLPLWIEGDRLAFQSDLAIERPAGDGDTFTYRVGAVPELAFAPPPIPAMVAVEPTARTLPEAFLGRETLSKLAAAAVAGATDDFARAQALVDVLRRTGRVDPTAPFRGWTDFATRRVGAPLHFAQCAALLLRLERLPARVARGYSCERWDAADRSFDVRAADEHWWVEVAFEGAGWVAIDPVPDLAQLTAEQLAEQQRAEEEARRDRVDRQSLESTFAQQRPLIVGMLLLLLVAAVFAFPTVRVKVEQLLLRRGPDGVGAPARRAWRFWQELIDRCGRHGLMSHPSFTAAEFASLVAHALPPLRRSLIELLALYHAGRFGGIELDPEQERQRARAKSASAAAPPRNMR